MQRIILHRCKFNWFPANSELKFLSRKQCSKTRQKVSSTSTSIENSFRTIQSNTLIHRSQTVTRISPRGDTISYNNVTLPGATCRGFIHSCLMLPYNVSPRKVEAERRRWRQLARVFLASTILPEEKFSWQSLRDRRT